MNPAPRIHARSCGLDPLAEVTVVELGPLHSQVDIVEPQFDQETVALKKYKERDPL
jgi:hypothetical protein